MNIECFQLRVFSYIIIKLLIYYKNLEIPNSSPAHVFTVRRKRKRGTLKIAHGKRLEKYGTKKLRMQTCLAWWLTKGALRSQSNI